MGHLLLSEDACLRALKARDARFDGLFFVGIISTGIYCRPICPARVSRPDHRRFFQTAAAAERAGFRPCLRCRPELAPGHAQVDAVSRLARAAAWRITAGALNGQSLAALARDLGVSERHLRRALEQELGVSPIELAQTQRLLLAKRLLADTDLPVTEVAYASGFQSLRRFNALFRERYGLSPRELRRGTWGRPGAAAGNEMLRLSLSYRAPFDWSGLLALLQRDLLPGVECIQAMRFHRTVRLGQKNGVVVVQDAPSRSCLLVDVSRDLLPALMPLMAGLRRLFDLDAEPAVVNASLAQGGLAALVRRRPGLRVPGALDGFEIALHTMLRGQGPAGVASGTLVRRVVATLGEPVETGVEQLSHVAPRAQQVAAAGAGRLTALGVSARRAQGLVSLASAVAGGRLRLEPGSDPDAVLRTLKEFFGVGERLATSIMMRALSWPDAFPAGDSALQRAAGVTSRRELGARAEHWRPWRAYAALHLQLQEETPD
jgi:AraC family transcriptional regulator, regulatory protein of adaptative response / DNA-3-methyladenine glycosylase II